MLCLRDRSRDQRSFQFSTITKMFNKFQAQVYVSNAHIVLYFTSTSYIRLLFIIAPFLYGDMEVDFWAAWYRVTVTKKYQRDLMQGANTHFHPPQRQIFKRSHPMIRTPQNLDIFNEKLMNTHCLSILYMKYYLVSLCHYNMKDSR